MPLLTPPKGLEIAQCGGSNVHLNDDLRAGCSGDVSPEGKKREEGGGDCTQHWMFSHANR